MEEGKCFVAENQAIELDYGWKGIICAEKSDFLERDAVYIPLKNVLQEEEYFVVRMEQHGVV